MMKQLGISIDELENVEEVRIRTSDLELIFREPDVIIMNAQGIKTYQISGVPEERPLIPQEDVKMVMEQTGADESTARSALEKAEGDLAKAIMELKEDEK